MEKIYCVARFLAKRESKSNLIEELALLIPETIKEQGCLHYELTEEVSYAGAAGECWDVSLIERWRSRKDFDDHCNQHYITNFFNVTVKTLVEKSDVRLYSIVSV